MAGELDKINEMFRQEDERLAQEPEAAEEAPAPVLPEGFEPYGAAPVEPQPETKPEEQEENSADEGEPEEDVVTFEPSTRREKSESAEASPESAADEEDAEGPSYLESLLARKEAERGERPAPRPKRKQRRTKVDRLFLDEKGETEMNGKPKKLSEHDYRPVRQNRETKSGCLGGLMYFVFIVCLAVIGASLAWMAASDALALNKDSFSAQITLPASVFETKTVDELDENGTVVGQKTVRSADISYVSDALKEAGLIQYQWLFELFFRISHADTKVMPGTYELKSSFDYRALIQSMHPGSGSAVTIKVTFPEGFTMEQSFRRLEENEVCSYDDLMEAAANYKYNYPFLEGAEPGEASRLEGYLFPDTYEFYVGMQASSAINKFLETFHYLLTADMLKQANDRGLSLRQIVTIASLIEKEAAVDLENDTSDRRLIASVIYNRLNRGMTLGIDASILYLYPEHHGAPTAEMLEVDSPYNTRLYQGLPPTPICSPSLAAIKAALNPEDTDYLYYALNTATGKHEFFTNERDFNAFVATQNYDG